MEFDEMRRMEMTHTCAQCDSPLVITWDMVSDCHQLVCSKDLKHQGYKEVSTAGRALARGEMDKHLGPGAQKEMERQAAEGAPALSWLHDKDIATGADLRPDQLLGLIIWAESLGFNPNLGHVCLYFSNPYVTIDGYYFKLTREHPDIKVGTRPLTREERDERQIPEGDHAWIAETWEKGEKLPTTGLGIVTQEEVEGKSTRRPDEFRAPVVHGHPQRMAEKRAEWQLLRKLIPLEETPSPP